MESRFPKQVLLISGPSGGGKSTFLEDWKAGRLGTEVAEDLPEESRGWPILEANNVFKEGMSLEAFLAEAGGEESVILHYDIVFMQRFGVTRLEEDPVMEVVRRAERLWVVFVRPEPERLRAQFDSRWSAHQKKKSWLSRVWARWVKQPMRKRRAARKGQPWVTTADLYRQSGWIGRCYEDWRGSLGRLVKGRRIGWLAISPGAEGARSWRREHEPLPGEENAGKRKEDHRS